VSRQSSSSNEKWREILTEEQEETNENTEVSPLVSVSIVKCDFEVSHTADLVLTRNGTLQCTSLRPICNGIAKSGDSCNVVRNDVLSVTSEVESLELVDHQ
jgi:hypothetical protein